MTKTDDVSDWVSAEDFEAVPNGNKPFSLKVPALIVTRGATGPTNIMLAMWFTPMGAEPSSFIVAISKSTKTYELLEETGEFVVAAPNEDMLDVLVYSGTASGHNEDKWARSGLTAVKPSKGSVPLVGEALGNVELKVARKIPFDDNYVLIVGEVQACLVKKGLFEAGIYLDHANPILWLGKQSGVKPPPGQKLPTYAAGMGSIRRSNPDAPLLKNAKK